MANAVHMHSTVQALRTARPLRQQVLHLDAAYHAHCQAVAPARASSARLAFLPQLRVAPRRRADLLVVRASWGAEVEFKPVKVVDRKPAATQLHRLQVDLGELAAGYTKPGQFVQIKVGDSKPGFFAIASPPDPNNAGVVELLIKDQGGAAELLCKANAGDEVLASPVMGKGFPVDRVPADTHPTVLCFATGSGISPVKALLESGALTGRCVSLFYGARTPDHMAYSDSLGDWEKAGIRVVPVFSEKGEGYVQDALAKEDGISDWGGVAAVVCGQKGMCEAVKEQLASKGVAPEHILLNF